MQKENIHKKITSIDEWLTGHKKLLFILGFVFVATIDIYSLLFPTLFRSLGYDPSIPATNIKYFTLYLAYNLLAFFFLPGYLFKFNIKNIFIYFLFVIAIYFLVCFLAITNNIDNFDMLVIARLLTFLRVILYIIIYVDFLLKKIRIPSIEFFLYLMPMIIYISFFGFHIWKVLYYFHFD